MSKIIFLVGGSGSGKTTISQELIKDFWSPEKADFISADNFFRDFSDVKDPEFDVPDAYDVDLLLSKITDLKNDKSVEIPHYDFATKKAEPKAINVTPKKFILVEGLFLLRYKELRDLADFSIVIQVDPDIQLARRLLRDQERLKNNGETLKDQIDRYMKDVKEGYSKWVAPSAKWADAVVENNDKLEDTISQIEETLSEVGLDG